MSNHLNPGHMKLEALKLLSPTWQCPRGTRSLFAELFVSMLTKAISDSDIQVTFVPMPVLTHSYFVAYDRDLQEQKYIWPPGLAILLTDIKSYSRAM